MLDNVRYLDCIDINDVLATVSTLYFKYYTNRFVYVLFLSVTVDLMQTTEYIYENKTSKDKDSALWQLTISRRSKATSREVCKKICLTQRTMSSSV